MERSLTYEAATEELVIIIVDRIVEVEPPHGVSGGRVHQAAVTGHMTHLRVRGHQKVTSRL